MVFEGAILLLQAEKLDSGDIHLGEKSRKLTILLWSSVTIFAGRPEEDKDKLENTEFNKGPEIHSRLAGSGVFNYG